MLSWLFVVNDGLRELENIGIKTLVLLVRGYKATSFRLLESGEIIQPTIDYHQMFKTLLISTSLVYSLDITMGDRAIE